VELKILVIGSNSFSGSAFINFCLQKGASVFGTSRSIQKSETFLSHKIDAKNFRFLQLDLNENIKEYQYLIKNENFDFIANFASQSMVGESWDNPTDWYRTNVLSTSLLYNFIATNSKISKLVHVTTPEVYGDCKGFVTEAKSFNPSTPYATSRAAGDFHLRNLGQQYGLPFIMTRASNVYGPHQQLYRIIPRAMYAMLTGEKLTLHGGGVSMRNFIHILDVCEATWKLMVSDIKGQEYHISGTRIISIRELVEIIAAETGKDFNDNVIIGPERSGKDLAYQLSSEKLKNEFGWKDEISLESGIKETFTWMSSNLTEMRKEPLTYIHKR